MKETLLIVLVIIGSLIGAGFASGQEIYSFFYSYEIGGICGIIITFLLIGILIYKSLKLIYTYEINDYDEFLEIFIKNKKISKVINTILNILLLVTFYVMIAGFGAYFEQELGIARIVGCLILLITSTIVFFTNVKGVLKVSQYIVPLLIGFIAIIGITNLINIDVETSKFINFKNGWFLSSITYCSYNFVLLILVLISLRKQIKEKKSILYIASLSSIIMLILSMLIFMLLFNLKSGENLLEMPVVFIIGKYFTQYKLIYAFIILASIFTTAISIGIGLLQNVSKTKREYRLFVIFMFITSLIVSNFGFSKLVNITYPIFGYIGIAQVIAICISKDA